MKREWIVSDVDLGCDGAYFSYTEIVRCKDCIHKPQENAKHFAVFPDEICPCQCDDPWYSWIPQDNFFCAFGERREDG